MVNDERVKQILPIIQALRFYHRHEVVGIDRIPDTSRALLVANHSLATYDIVLLMGAIYYETGRIARPLIDRLFFKVPGIGSLATAFGAVEGNPANARQLLEQDALVTVAPGGMREALRPSTRKYRIDWFGRRGFVRLAATTGSPIVLAACPKADDLYKIYPSLLTSWAYETFRIPVFFARGIGLSPIPRPVRLVHFLSEPIQPPHLSKDPKEQEEQVRRFHHLLVERMNELMAEAIAAS